jgi:hypothetical protein
VPDTPVNAFVVPFLFFVFYTLIIGIYLLFIIGIYLLFIIINILKQALNHIDPPCFPKKTRKKKKKEIILFIFFIKSCKVTEYKYYND